MSIIFNLESWLVFFRLGDIHMLRNSKWVGERVVMLWSKYFHRNLFDFISGEGEGKTSRKIKLRNIWTLLYWELFYIVPESGSSVHWSSMPRLPIVTHPTDQYWTAAKPPKFSQHNYQAHHYNFHRISKILKKLKKIIMKIILIIMWE